MPATEILDSEGVYSDLLTVTTSFLRRNASLTQPEPSIKLTGMTPVAKIAAESAAPARSPRKSRQLLAEALSQPEGSSEERQTFSHYLDALRDENAK